MVFSVETLPDKCRKCAVFSNLDVLTSSLENFLPELTKRALEKLDAGDHGSRLVAKAALADLQLVRLAETYRELTDLGNETCPGPAGNSRSISLLNTPQICRNPAFEKIIDENEELKTLNITNTIWSGEM